MKMLIQHKIQTGFSVAMAFMFFIGAIAWWSAQWNLETFRMMNNTNKVLDEFDAILVEMLNAETGSRGFAISGDETFLQSYQPGILTIQKSLEAAKQLTQDNPSQHRQLVVIESLINKKIAFVNKVIQLRRSGDTAGALELIALGQGKQMMYDIRRLIGKMGDEENQLLRQHTEKVHEQFRTTIAIVIFGSLLAVGLVGLASVMVRRDFEKRQQAEKSLRASEQYNRSIVESGEDCLKVFNLEGRLLEMAAPGRRLMGVTDFEQIRNAEWVSFWQRIEDREAVQCALDAARAGLTGRFQGFTPTMDGRPKWWDVIVSPILDADGKVDRILSVSRDITERKTFERSLQEASRIKSEFLANMSHELRTPLNGIIGFAEFLVDGRPGTINAKQKEYLGDILNCGQHLLQLINDVLDLAKVEAGKMELYPVSFTLAQAIDEVCAVTKPMEQKNSIKISVDVSSELQTVTLDQQKFKQVLYNLLSNAIKFSNEGCGVEVSAAPLDTDRFKLSVKDTGIGIKPEDIKRLFHDFEQLDSGSARHYEGTGLGLALTRKIVELMGGIITVESEVGKGSTFSVELPLVIRET